MKNKNNFYQNTQADWIPSEKPYSKPDFISTTGNGKFPSEYWFFEDKVVRYADHWGIVQDCLWTISRKMIAGHIYAECKYSDFLENSNNNLLQIIKKSISEVITINMAIDLILEGKSVSENKKDMIATILHLLSTDEICIIESISTLKEILK